MNENIHNNPSFQALQELGKLREQYLTCEQNLKYYLESNKITYSLHEIKLLIIMYYNEEVESLQFAKYISEYFDGSTTYSRAIYPQLLRDFARAGLIEKKMGKKQTVTLHSLTKKGKETTKKLLEILRKFEK